MKIMLDTNILISAALFPSDRLNHIFEFIVTGHELVLSDIVIEELNEVAASEKFNRADAVKQFLEKLSFTEYKSPPARYLEGLSIRDEDDYSVLFAAVKSNVDIFITGDKDFLESGVTTPSMMSLSGFEAKYCG